MSHRDSLVRALAILAVLNALVWYAVLAESRGGRLSVSFLDVGQGDAIYIEGPAGAQVLIDGGPDAGVLRALGEEMPFYDRSIDAVVATHPDADHIGGLPAVFSRYRVGAFLSTDAESDTELDDVLASVASSSGAVRVPAVRGTVLDLGGGAKLSIVFPDRPMRGAETNDASVVAKLSYGEVSFLFTGDAPKRVETYVSFLDGAKLESAVLKVGHHGSDTSTSERFVALVAPDYAVISAGEGNRYGHPKEAVVASLAAAGAAVSGTMSEGTITFETDGVTLIKK